MFLHTLRIFGPYEQVSWTRAMPRISEFFGIIIYIYYELQWINP